MENTYTSPLISKRDPDAPALWVGCLAAYNAGTLHGEWMQISPDRAEMLEAISEILKASPEPHAEEWDIMDTDGVPAEVRGLDAAAAYAAALDDLKHHPDPAGLLAAWMEWRGADDLNASHIEDAYLGQFGSVQEYAEQYADDCGLLDGLPEHLRPYFNFAAFARDLELSGDVYEGAGGHLFNGHA